MFIPADCIRVFLSSFPSSSDEPLLLSLAALSTSPWLRVSVAFLPCGSGHRRFSPSSALHPQYPPLRQFLSRYARTITSSSRPSHRLLSRMLFGNIRYAVPPARSQCGRSPCGASVSARGVIVLIALIDYSCPMLLIPYFGT